jgi:hypothetical protein
MTKYKYWNVSYGIGQHNCALNYFHFPYFELIHTHTHPSMYFQHTHTHQCIFRNPSMYFQHTHMFKPFASHMRSHHFSTHVHQSNTHTFTPFQDTHTGLTHPSMYFQTPINVFSAHTHV